MSEGQNDLKWSLLACKGWASLLAQMVKNLPAMQKMFGSLGREDSLEKEMATHPSVLTWRIPRTEEPGRLQSMGSQSQTLLSTHQPTKKTQEDAPEREKGGLGTVTRGSDGPSRCLVWAEQAEQDCETILLGHPDAMDMLSRKQSCVCHQDQQPLRTWDHSPSEQPLTLQPLREGTFSLLHCQSVQSLSHVRFFSTPQAAARQASLSITNSWSLLKVMSIESVMSSNHLILCHPLLLPPSIFPSIRVFSNESALSHQVAKVLEFQLQHQSFQWIFKTDIL